MAYDGTNYAGWQSQPEKITVQSEIEKVLKKIVDETILIHGSGRTDAKVHATGQVFHFDSNVVIDCDSWKRAFNALLPKDIVVYDVVEVAKDAHCRRDAISKQYEYRLNMGEYNLFQRNHIYQLNQKLDVEKMKEASLYFVGTHDFSSFCANTKEEKENQVRTIFDIQLKIQGDILSIQFIGDGFMRYMVRMLVGGLIEVGRGKIEPTHLKEILDKQDKDACNYNSDPCGLYLMQVKY
ncbi:MAG: tRNA pseudouridine(38-40) synthase TruA [Anaerorhabdus sp.]